MTENGSLEPSRDPEPAPSRRRFAPSFQIILFGGTLMVSLGLVGTVQKYWGRDIPRLGQELAAEKKREAELGAIKKSFEVYQWLTRELQVSIGVIDLLQRSRRNPVGWMGALTKALGGAAQVNFSSVTQQGTVLVLEGEAPSAKAGAKIRASLEGTGRFSCRDFGGAGEKATPGGATYKFALYCALSPLRESAPEESSRPTGRNARRGQAGKAAKD